MTWDVLESYKVLLHTLIIIIAVNGYYMLGNILRLTYIKLIYSSQKPIKFLSSSSSFYRWVNQGTEKLSNLLKVTQFVSGEVRIWT